MGRKTKEEKAVLRFAYAQARQHRDAVRELLGGKKRTHWMWFEFPQICGLGYSETAKYYEIQSEKELNAFVKNKYLNQNLRELFGILMKSRQTNAVKIFGEVDAMKLHSCLSLFRFTKEFHLQCECLLSKYFNGVSDEKTDFIYERKFIE